MKNRIALLLLVVLALVLAACTTSTREVTTYPDRPSAESSALSRILASIDQALTDLLGVPTTPPVSAARLNLRVARAGLPTPANPAHVKEAKERSALVLAGKESEAEKQASAAEAQVVADLQAARAERDKAKQELQNERERNAKALQDAKDEAAGSVWKTIRFWGAAVLYFVAIAALVLAVLRLKSAIATGVDIIAGMKSTGTLLTLSATCFSVARFMASDWFWYGCGGVIALFLGYLGYLAHVERKGDAALKVLTPIRRALDHAYDEATPEIQKDMQARVFNPIAEQMKAVKAPRSFLHLNRAADKAKT
jgi:hypothetical protein